MKKYTNLPVTLSLLMTAFMIFSNIKGSNPDFNSIKGKHGVNEPFALMEIFTSEGCSSCPPAYKVTDDLVDKGRKMHKNIWVLDFHVDYLNGMGWVDSFSSKEYTLRQQNYSKKFPDEGVYTPQMIVNGAYVLLASDSEIAAKTVAKALETVPTCGIHLLGAKNLPDDSLKVSYSGANIPANSIINFALVQHVAPSKIIRGENKGKTLIHHNVVRILKTIPYQNADGSTALGGFVMKDKGNFSVIAYVQDADKQDVLAADEWNMGK